MTRPAQFLIAACCIAATSFCQASIWERIHPAGAEAKRLPPPTAVLGEAAPETTPPERYGAPGFELGFAGTYHWMDDDWHVDPHAGAGIFLQQRTGFPWLRAYRITTSFAETDTERRLLTLSNELTPGATRVVNVSHDDPLGPGDSLDGSSAEIVTGDRKRDSSTEVYRLALDLVLWKQAISDHWRLETFAGAGLVHLDDDFESETGIKGHVGAGLERVPGNGAWFWGLQIRGGYSDLDYNFNDDGTTASFQVRIGRSF